MSKKAIVLHGMLQCILNRNLCQRIRNYLVLNGYSLSSSVKNADIIVYSGCGVIESCEMEGLKEINHIENKIREAGRGQKLILVGCLPKINQKTKGLHETKDGKFQEMLIGNHYSSDINSQFVIVDNYNYGLFDDIINAAVPFEDVPYPTQIGAQYGIESINFIYDALNIGVSSEQKRLLHRNYIQQAILQSRIMAKEFFYPAVNDFLHTYGFNQITIGHGCKNSCTYCAVKFAKNKIKSVSIDEIIIQMIESKEKGQTKFMLISDDLGSWGLDIKQDWTVLLNEIEKIDDGSIQLALFNLKVEDMLRYKSELDKHVNTGRIAYIGAMAQHVNKRILNLMKREPFEKDQFIDIVNEYGNKQAHIDTYFIVGFPGETENEFNELIDFLKKINTVHFTLFTLPYSDRKGTAAETYNNKIPKETIMKRVEMMNESYANTAKSRLRSLPGDLQEDIISLHKILSEHEVLYQQILGSEKE